MIQCPHQSTELKQGTTPAEVMGKSDMLPPPLSRLELLAEVKCLINHHTIGETFVESGPQRLNKVAHNSHDPVR
ncbi:hypothetical protein EJB05_16682, partial [Eragrostis curvula]